MLRRYRYHRRMGIAVDMSCTGTSAQVAALLRQPSTVAVEEEMDSPLRKRWRMSDTVSAIPDSARLLQVLRPVSEQVSEQARELASVSSAGRALIAHDPTGCISRSHALSAVTRVGAAGKISPDRWPQTGEDGRLSASSFSESEASPGLLLEWNSRRLLLECVGSMTHVRRWPSTRRTGVVTFSTIDESTARLVCFSSNAATTADSTQLPSLISELDV